MFPQTSEIFRHSSKCFAQIYRAQYENAMLVYLCGTPIWRPEDRANIWNLLWLSRRMIISTEQISICVSTFPNVLSSKKLQKHTPYSKMAAASDDLGRVARERGIEGHDSMFTCLHVVA